MPSLTANLIYSLSIFTCLNLDNILSFDEDFKSYTYFSRRKDFKTFNGSWLKPDLLTFVYVEYLAYVVFVFHINRKYKMHHILNLLCFRLASSKSIILPMIT